MSKSIPVKISGAAHAKKDFDRWGWDEAPQKMLETISRNAASVVIDQMVKEIKQDGSFLMSWPQLTFWPIGLDTPQIDFDLRKILNEELDELEEDIRKTEYHNRDHEAAFYKKVAAEFSRMAKRYAALAEKAGEKDAPVPRYDRQQTEQAPT
jgi:hypothetical protein